METGTTIIGAVLIAIFILPFIIFGYIGKKRKNKMLLSLRNFADQHLCKISKYDIARNFVIGTDEINNILFFYKKNNEKTDKQFVDLQNTQKCMILNNNRPMKYSEGNFGAIEKIDLHFFPVDKSIDDVNIEFFNSEYDLRLTNELQLAEKWLNIANQMLKKDKK
jgi:hypothetical protein